MGLADTIITQGFLSLFSVTMERHVLHINLWEASRVTVSVTMRLIVMPRELIILITTRHTSERGK